MLRVVSRSSLLLVAAGVAVACSSDAGNTPTAPAHASDPLFNKSEGRGVFQRYIAIGTSVSAGVASDGLIATSQANAWPAQLAALAGRTITQPYISGTGCKPPLVAPLTSGVRLDGEPITVERKLLPCSPLAAGVRLPVDNLSLSGALAADALFSTPENVTDLEDAKSYARVLQPGETQISTLMGQNPKLVSVELGANEVLGAKDGEAIVGVTIYPYQAWQPLYDAILDSVQKVSKMALVVGLVDDVAHFPSFRRGDELWADRAEFGVFNVSVSADCQGSANLIFVPARVLTAVFTGKAYEANNLGPFTLSCAAGSPTDVDEVLTPSEAAIVNNALHDMDAHMRSEAKRRDLAFFRLGDLYDRPDLKAPFSVVTMMTSSTPFGPLISLDGLHPSAAGQTVLARAAAQAMNARYDLGMPLP